MYTLDDFRRDLISREELHSRGASPLTSVARWLPGIGRTLDRLETMLDSYREHIRQAVRVIDAMTVIERRMPDTYLDARARERIAQVAGVEPAEVDALLAAFHVATEIARRRGSA